MMTSCSNFQMILRCSFYIVSLCSFICHKH
jgi:hypothetical protein